LATVKALTDRGVTLVSTSDGIDSSTAAGRMMIGVLGSLAEYERELIKPLVLMAPSLVAPARWMTPSTSPPRSA
jgi:hypothetical protein